MCNSRTAAQLPDICWAVTPLKNVRLRAAMEAACRRTAYSIRFRPLHIPHAITLMGMVLTFHTKDPNRVGDAINLFVFPDLSLSTGSKDKLLT